MSLETWKDEFYPIAADRVARDPLSAIAHSLRKWFGLRPDALKKHHLTRRMFGTIIHRNATLSIDDRTCALCVIYKNQNEYGAAACTKCPLAIARGGTPCDRVAPAELRQGKSPYAAFIKDGNVEPMIAALTAALMMVIQTTKVKRRPAKRASQPRRKAARRSARSRPEPAPGS